ncbi:hypothetical protein P175DRAFT_0496908 [Aspergillus ochraceoroseus IBT 24754]|uniref:Uncharacterized protein n=1 Tax=Aspergillus ochraceoroseus IBT 24754 TaxID=1392256 RepID=A0A2T5M5G1_9EURO|nr:uncharacterized protein P175DRAFT_0496908 [Aspergillus ochraceoroseus IBT 24754]PTU23773.1 hypothetical protein P175DRAFT_0496908 [Aspergillus ochraceoroseus IBT 24754]
MSLQRMFQPRTMLLRPRRAGWVEGPILAIRHFSVSGKCFENDPSAPKSPSTRPRKTNIPPANLNTKNVNSSRALPRRIVDARSLAASKTDGKPVNILRSPAIRNSRGGPPNRARKPRAPSKSRPQQKDRKAAGRRRFQKNSDAEEGDDVQKAELENVYQELAEKTKPTPTRYQPQPPSLQNLSETWPSLPIGTTASAAGVVDKLSLLSGRTIDGYVPPNELGKRLFEGQYVRFLSEEERSEALAAAKSLAQEQADKLSQEKGDLVDPQPVNFKRASEEEQKSLVQSLVQGKYPGIKPNKESPLFGEIVRNLRNNETYQAAGKSSQFMTKIESLMASRRPAKRA